MQNSPNLFLNVRFPEKKFKFQKSVIEFFTIIQSAKNGAENRIILNSFGRMKYLFEGGITKKSDIEILANFFKIVKGRGFSFRFFDENEHSAVREKLLQTGEGTFQLIKTYKFLELETSKNITKPIFDSLKLTFEGAELVEKADFIADYSSGNIKILNEKYLQNPEKLTATYNFDTEVRFENDELKLSQDKFGNLSINEVTLTEII